MIKFLLLSHNLQHFCHLESRVSTGDALLLPYPVREHSGWESSYPDLKTDQRLMSLQRPKGNSPVQNSPGRPVGAWKMDALSKRSSCYSASVYCWHVGMWAQHRKRELLIQEKPETQIFFFLCKISHFFKPWQQFEVLKIFCGPTMCGPYKTHLWPTSL